MNKMLHGIFILIGCSLNLMAESSLDFEAVICDFSARAPAGASYSPGSKAAVFSNGSSGHFKINIANLQSDMLPFRNGDYKELEISYKGDGKPGVVTLRAAVKTEGKGTPGYYVHIPMEFEDWRTTRLSGFWTQPGNPPIKLSEIRDLSLEGNGARGIAIRSIKLIGGREMSIAPVSLPILFVPCVDKMMDKDALSPQSFNGAATLTDFKLRDRSGKAKYPTQAHLICAGGRLAVKADLHGEASGEIAVKCRKDDDSAIFDDSCLETYFDPGCTGKSLYQYIVNAAGAKTALKDQVMGWNPEWKPSACGFDNGWSAYACFDLRAMGGIPSQGDVWGYNMKRHVAGKTPGAFLEVSAWSATSSDDPEKLGFLVFGDKSPSNANVKNVELRHRDNDKFSLSCEFVSLPDSELDVSLRLKAPRGTYQKVASTRLAPAEKMWIPFTYRAPESGEYMMMMILKDVAGRVVDVRKFSLFLAPEPHAIPADELVLWPEPQRLELKDGYFPLAGKTTISISGDGDRFPGEHLCEMLERRYGVKCEIAKSGVAKIELKYIKGQEIKPEGFTLSVKKDGVELTARDGRGMYYGVRALLEIAAQSPAGAEVRMKCLECHDWPATQNRALQFFAEEHYARNPGVDAMKRFIYDLVAGGRYNIFIMNMRNNMEFKRHPEVANFKTAFSQKEMFEIIAFARRHYLEVVPSNNAPGHCNWLLKSHPEFSEAGSKGIMCTRNPAAMALLKDLHAEMIEVFKPERFFHLNGDEVMWETPRPGKECKSCRDIAKPELLLQFWREMGAFCKERNLRPIIYSDMLSKTWHGGLYGTDKILPLLPKDFIIAQWGEAQFGIPPRQIRDAGFDAWRINTSFGAYRMESFPLTWKDYSGDGIALTLEWPWCNWGMYPYKTICDYSCPAIFSNAACIWKPGLSAINRELFIASRGSHWTRMISVPELGGRTGLKALDIGAACVPAPAEFDGFPKGKFSVEEFPFSRPENENLALAVSGKEVSRAIRMDAKIKGLAMFQSHSAGEGMAKGLIAKFRYENKSEFGMPVAYYVIRYADGSVVKEPALLGWDVHVSNCAPAARVMLGVTTYSVVSCGIQSSATAWVKSWKNPRPEVAVESVALEGCDVPGNFVMLGVAAYIERTESRKQE